MILRVKSVARQSFVSISSLLLISRIISEKRREAGIKREGNYVRCWLPTEKGEKTAGGRIRHVLDELDRTEIELPARVCPPLCVLCL